MATIEIGAAARLAILVGWLGASLHAGAAGAAVEGQPFYSDGAGSSERVRTSLELCAAAADPEAPDRRAAFEEGLRLAERAVEEEPADARAHFALFCHLGRRAQAAGVSADALSVVGRMRDAVERALELQPTYVDALVGHGAMLLELPWFLGGDEERGEDLLRRALALDRGFEPAIVRLASHLEEQDRMEEMPVHVAHRGSTPEG